MSKIHGRLSNFRWNTIAVNGLVDVGNDMERPEINVTTHDSGDFEEFIQGRLTGSIDLSGKWDEADAGQSGMQADFISGTSRAVVFRMQDGAGNHEFTGTGQITSWGASGPNSDAAEITTTVRLSGTITEATQ